ncbi:hypothetical protein MKW98_001835 [Papaver atlanticum]|uniref:Transmembrane protein n=1 Tax=Papaver atlanticum TaxID=357466 RepID=A0AAD4XAR2_9MAGN|nr:hypothetical protein MKW98_001835 [Papaver atlanticum]
MDLFTAAEDLKFLSEDHQIIKEALKIPSKSSPIKFFLITVTLILPLSLMQLLLETHSFILFFILADYFSGDHHSSPSYKQFIRTYSIHEFFYILSLFLFSLLSTSAIVFTVASLYASKPVSFIPTLFAIPRIFKHLVITFFYVFLLMIVSYLAYYVPISVLAAKNINGALFWVFSIIFGIIYDLVHIYVTAQWHLASVISVLEPNGYGLEAMKKSTQLLRGRTSIAFGLALLYLGATWTLEFVFEFALESQVDFMFKLLLGLLCLFMLVVVNLTGLLVQSVFYYACKSHHNEVVDKKLLYDHLGSYDLGDKSVALNPSCTGSVEMQSLVKDDHHRVGYQFHQISFSTISTDSTIKMERSVKDDDIVGDLINV